MSAALMISVLQACSRQTVFSDLVDEVTVSLADNSLRIAVDVVFKAKTSWHVEYWPSDSDGSNRTSTAIYESERGTNRAVVKFLYPDTAYNLQIVIDGETSSKVVTVKTGNLPVDIPSYIVETSDQSTWLEGYLMQWEASTPGYVTFCDFDGKVVWYQAFGEAVRTAVLDPATSRLAVLTGFKEGEDNDDFFRLAANVIVSDLDGNILLKRRSSPDFLPFAHHELCFMPDGSLLSLQNSVKTFDLTSRGGAEQTPVYGEGFLVVDFDGNIKHQWDCFGELDPVSIDYLDPVKVANDYIHSNSVACDSNGDFYMTSNRLTELWKIDGRSGEVVYRVGPHGDVEMDGGTFKGGLHAAVVLAPDVVLCYANGSDRGVSSAVVFNIDPVSKTGHYDLKLDLPAHYSSVNRSNVNFISDDTLLFSNTMSGRAVFMKTDGTILRVISRSGISYRGYWFSSDSIRY